MNKKKKKVFDNFHLRTRGGREKDVCFRAEMKTFQNKLGPIQYFSSSLKLQDM
jgi:hypothetical protein